MELVTALSRAKRGFRDDLRLHGVAVASLVVAFLCLGAALLSVANLSQIAERWGKAQHLTVYLKGDAKEGDIAQLRLVLESLQEVSGVKLISAADAKREFSEQVDLGIDASALPSDAFPASLEVDLRASATDGRISEIAGRVRRFGAVEEVETYEDWFTQMHTLLGAGKSAVGLLSLLVAICVLAIIGNTIRLAILNRKHEIEVLKLCGATDAYVRGPFVLEGILQAAAAALTAMILLAIAFFAVRGHLEATLGAVTGVRTVFLSPLLMLGIILGGALVGAIGSALSLRRHLSV